MQNSYNCLQFAAGPSPDVVESSILDDPKDSSALRDGLSLQVWGFCFSPSAIVLPLEGLGAN